MIHISKLNSDSDTQESARLEALRSYDILDTEHEDDFDRITKLASIICEVPISLITLIDENRQWFKSKAGLDSDVNEIALDISFCQYVIQGTTFFEVEDAITDIRFKENPFVVGPPKVRFYGSIPLIDPAGHALGALCVVDTVPNKLSERQQEALELLAQEVIEKIVSRKTKRENRHATLFFRLSDQILLTIDKEQDFIKFNPAFTKYLDWTENDLQKKKILHIIHPDDMQILNMELAKIKLNHQENLYFKIRMQSKSGNYIKMECRANAEEHTGYLFIIAKPIC